MSEKISKTIQLAGRKLTLETGFLAMQANGAVVASYGDTKVLVTVVAADPRDDIDYFPLSVEYEERLYAGGIIKGSRWVKREGRPTDEAILNGRIIDRSVRPLFPKEFHADVQIVVTVLSVDVECDPVGLSTIATSAAIKVAGLPWDGPIAAARVGLIGGNLVLNPTLAQGKESSMDLFVSGTKDQVLMVEMGGDQIPYEKIIEAIFYAHQEIAPVFNLIDELASEAHEKLGVSFHQVEEPLTAEQEKELVVLDEIHQDIVARYPKELLDTNHKKRHEIESAFLTEIFAKFEGKVSKSKMKAEFEKVAKKMLRKKVVSERLRVDGRKLDEVRPITIEVGVLGRTHGSAIFQRGETQVLSVATLGSTSLEQLIENAYGEYSKRYFHHYNFPPFSTGETGRVGSPKRREIGHGALAEKAIEPVLPTDEVFPYTIRVVSEVLSSNGSTSMASTCGSTLALMDAGVPIKEPVSGIAMGLIKEASAAGGGDDFVILSDIMGVEDFYGDMDFKVTGTKNGITALQLDTKVDGLSREIFEKALQQAEIGRAHILGEMLKAISEPRQALSVYAPKIKTVKINPKRIGDLIGPGGKIIRALQEETQTQIDVQDDGMVHVAGVDQAGLDRAVSQIDLLTKDVEVGQVYEGRVNRIMDFGAFVELLPGKDGLVHISELSPGYVKSVTDVVKEGDIVKVKVIGIDDQGRVNLSRKVMMGEDRAQDTNPKPLTHDQSNSQGNKVYHMDRDGGRNDSQNKPHPDHRRHS